MRRIIGRFDHNEKITDYIRHDNDLEILNNLAYGKKVSIAGSDELLLLFSGTLFNKNEIKSLFNIKSDDFAEIALDVYQMKKKDGLKQLDGAFLIIIQSESEMCIIRDRHGIGGQFFYTGNAFASSVSDLKLFTDLKPEPDFHGISAFLQRGYIPAPLTALKGVKKLEAGHVLKISEKETSVINLFPVEDFKFDVTLNADDACKKFEELHELSIRRRINGYDKVGILLSGGYDSGGNIYQLRKVFSGQVEAFSVGFDDNPWTEVPLADLMAKHFGAGFHSYNINGSELSFLPQIVKQTGDPFQEGGLMVNYCVMKMVAEHDIPVILGGDANDQFFGTAVKETAVSYTLNKYYLAPFTKLLQKVTSSTLLNNNNMAFRLNFHLSKIHEILHPDAFGLTTGEQKRMLTNREFSPFDPFADKKYKADNFDSFYLFRNYYVDIQQVINEVILFKAGRMAELWGQNLRFPYADVYLYNFLKDLPRELKASGTVADILHSRGTAKFLHKKYLKPVLPPEITSRKKQGGFAPLPVFFRNDERRAAVFNFISSSEFGQHFIDQHSLNSFRDIYNKINGNPQGWFWHKQVMAFKLMNLLTLTIWWDIFIGNKDYKDLSGFNI